MCLSPSFQGGSESLINTFKEILRCWLHPTFDFSQVSATPLFNLCAYSQNQTSVRHLKNLITVFSLHLFPRDLFWSSRLGGGQDIASVKADRGVLFQSKCLPWSVQAAGGQGYTADVNRGPKADVHQHQDRPNQQSSQCSQVLLFMSSLSKLS